MSVLLPDSQHDLAPRVRPATCASAAPPICCVVLIRPGARQAVLICTGLPAAVIGMFAIAVIATVHGLRSAGR